MNDKTPLIQPAQIEQVILLIRGQRVMLDRDLAALYGVETYQFMAAVFEVFNDRGYGLAEEIYQECLEIELELRGIAFHAKAALKCSYKGRESKKRYVPDLFVFGSLVVELKAVVELAPEHEAQLLNYMRIARQPAGYLVNFGHKETLEWKRFILSEYIPPSGQAPAPR